MLEEVGFLDRAIPPSGSRYRATEEGLHRKAILFVFGSEYAPAFIAANARAAAAHGGQKAERRPVASKNTRLASPVNFRAQAPAANSSLSGQPLNSPKSKSEADKTVIMGEVRKGGILPKAFEPNQKLEAALDRLLQGIRQSRSG